MARIKSSGNKITKVTASMATGASAPRISLTLPPVRTKSSRLQSVQNAKASVKLRTDLDEEETGGLEDFTRTTTNSQNDDVSLNSAVFRQPMLTVTARLFSSVASAVTEGSLLHVNHVRVRSVPNVSNFRRTCRMTNRISSLPVQTAFGLFQVQGITNRFRRTK